MDDCSCLGIGQICIYVFININFLRGFPGVLITRARQKREGGVIVGGKVCSLGCRTTSRVKGSNEEHVGVEKKKEKQKRSLSLTDKITTRRRNARYWALETEMYHVSRKEVIYVDWK